MNLSIQKSVIYEIEGLYELLEKSDISTEKANQINNLIDRKLSDLVKERHISASQQDNAELIRPGDVAACSATTLIDDEIARNAIFEEQSDADLTGNDIEYGECASVSVSPDDNRSPEASDNNSSAESVSDFLETEIEGAEVDSCASSSDDPQDNPPLESSDVPTLAPIEIIASPNHSYQQEPVNVNSSVLRNRAGKDVKSAFTLNDKFRFCRELFGNSQSNFNDAINIISAMHDYNEATDYFYSDLGWDKKNPDVADFMEIVKTILSK